MKTQGIDSSIDVILNLTINTHISSSHNLNIIIKIHSMSQIRRNRSKSLNENDIESLSALKCLEIKEQLKKTSSLQCFQQNDKNYMNLVCDEERNFIYHQQSEIQLSNQTLSYQNYSLRPALKNDKFRQLALVTDSTRANDFSCLYNNKQIIKTLQLFREKKEMMPNCLRDQLKIFLDVLKVRVQHISNCESSYNDLFSEVRKIEKEFEYYGTKRNTELLQSAANDAIRYLAQDLETKPKRQSVLYVEIDYKKVALSEHMSQIGEMLKNHKWRDIMQRMQHSIELINLDEERSDNREILKIRKRFEFGLTPYRHPAMAIACLGCTPYFVMNWNVFDLSVNKTKLVVAKKVKELLLKNEDAMRAELSLKKEVCGLLNGGGGVILFDSDLCYLDVIPRGEFLIKSEVEAIRKRIEDILNEGVYPRPVIGQNVVVSIVPMVKDPLQFEQNKEPKTLTANKLDFQSGLFVVRIVVRPTVAAEYCYKMGKKCFFVCRYKSLVNDIDSIIERQVKEPIEQKEVKSMKPKKPKSWVTALLQQPFTDFDHKHCDQPFLAEIPTERPVSQQFSINENKDFEFASALVTNQQNAVTIRQRLKKYNLDFSLEFPFLNQKFRGAKGTAILYHNNPYSEVMSAISYNKEFEFNGKFTVIYLITECIRLSDRKLILALPKQDLIQLQQWQKQIPYDHSCQVRLYKIKNKTKEIQYFIKLVPFLSSKNPQVLQGQKRIIFKSILFLYLLLSHFDNRVQMINLKEMGIDLSNF